MADPGTAPLKLQFQPGVKRDGTVLNGNACIDAQWCRWQRALPRKIGGFRNVSQTLTEKVYGMDAFVSNAQEYIHTGSASKLMQQTLSSTALLQTSSDRTPAGLVVDANNNWQFAVLFDAVSNSNRLIAHAAPNLADIANATNTKIWYGDITATGVLVDTAVATVSGGVCAAWPYLFKYGNDGEIDWSVPNKPADFSNAGSGGGRVAEAKIVRMLPMRGGGSGPAALAWSLNALIRASFTGGTTIWAFDTISDDQSVLSSNGIIEYDGIFYWAGVDRFMMFNGVVREIPNEMNLNWFFDGLNFAWRQKVFAIKMPRWGEIWWCYPRGTATECTHAVIYNVRENTWYDTQLPGSGRSAGSFAKVYEHPFMMGVDLTASNTYRLWKHEEGVDAVDNQSITAVDSYFQTNEITALEGQQAGADALRCTRVEPDFIQVGDMTISISGRSNARAAVRTGSTVTMPADATATPTAQTAKFKEAYRLMRFKFESNVVGGDYQMGDTYVHIGPADGRVED